MTIREVVACARERLEHAGITAAEAALDAQLLARDLLACDRAAFITRQSEPFPHHLSERFDALVTRRETREPMAYIRGRQEFYDRDFVVSPAVLIPRPETELIVEEALLLLPALGYSRSLKVIDIGTGSGCLAISLASEYGRARYVATDLSAEALEMARQNASRLGVADRIEFVHGSYFAGVTGPFNLIVANPPYVTERERGMLQPEVRDHEPSTALFGGPDGLRHAREILRGANEQMDDDGSLLMEIGNAQLDGVAAAIDEFPRLTLVRTRRDLQGIERMVVVRRRQ